MTAITTDQKAFLSQLPIRLTRGGPAGLQGLNVDWMPCGRTTAADALSDISTLLAQAIEVLWNEPDELKLAQFAAVQQLGMAKSLLDAVQNALC